jgi:hypothetical protein
MLPFKNPIHRCDTILNSKNLRCLFNLIQNVKFEYANVRNTSAG